MLALGLVCGLHRVERVMRGQAFRARPRRRRLPVDMGDRPAGGIAANGYISPAEFELKAGGA